jgi:hypothetical protein
MSKEAEEFYRKAYEIIERQTTKGIGMKTQLTVLPK